MSSSEGDGGTSDAALWAYGDDTDDRFDADALPPVLRLRTALLGIGWFVYPWPSRPARAGGCFRSSSTPPLLRTGFGTDSVRTDSLISTVTSVPHRRRRRHGGGGLAGTVGWLAATARGLAAAGFFSSSDASCRCRFEGRSWPTLSPGSPTSAFGRSAAEAPSTGSTSPSNSRRQRFETILEVAFQRFAAALSALATIS